MAEVIRFFVLISTSHVSGPFIPISDVRSAAWFGSEGTDPMLPEEVTESSPPS